MNKAIKDGLLSNTGQVMNILGGCLAESLKDERKDLQVILSAIGIVLASLTQAYLSELPGTVIKEVSAMPPDAQLRRRK